MLVLRFSPSFCATRRVTVSELPPGGNGTMMVIGREGKSDWAWAGAAPTATRTQPNANAIAVLIIPLRSVEWSLRRVALAPQFGAGKPGAFGQRAQLGPHDARVNPLRERTLGEAAVGAAHHVLAADNLGEPRKPLRHQLG